MHDVYGDSWTKSADPDDVIGKGEAWIEDEKLIVRITFEPADLNPRADKIFRKLEFGSLHAVSVGFRATKKGHMGDEERGEDPKVYYYNGQELLEVSVVNIPANANALKRSMEEEEAVREYEEKAEEPQAVVDTTAEEPADYTSTIARARALLAKNNI
jgi:HK97 family phage prohead protease